MITTKKLDWELLIDDIRDEKCVLILGAEAYLNENNQSIHQVAFEHLDIENSAGILRYYEEDNLFLFEEGYKRRICNRLRKFYDAQKPPSLFNKLARIPFHLWLVGTPDLLVPSVFEQNGFTFQFDYFSKEQKPSSVEHISNENPLIYNVFGSIKDEESLVMTHNELFEYFESLFAQRGIPAALKNTLYNAKQFLFVGVPFDRWYFQVLLRLLNIRRDFNKVQSFAASQTNKEEVLTFCRDQFNMNFIHKNVHEFIDTLLKKCEDFDLPLRDIASAENNQGQTLFAKAEKALKEGKPNDAIQIIMDYVEEKDDELFRLSLSLLSRFNRLRMKIAAGVMDSRDEKTAYAEITNSTIDLIEDAKLLAIA